ncbi:unnamed protein product [Rhizopus stolonifer]
MKFSVELNSRIREPWRESYIQYSKLNIFLKDKLETQWTDKHEYTFINNVEIELKKVYTFVRRGLDGLVHRIDQCNALFEKQRNRFSVPSSFDYITDTLADIIIDMDQLAKFHELNLAGFRRIIEKHDTRTPHNLHDFFYENMLGIYPLDKQRFDVLIVQISRMYDLCRHQNTPRYLNRSSVYFKGAGETAFENTTDTYWIHPDHITEVKAMLMLQLPVHLFNQNKPYDISDSAVTSVYYDNDTFDVYRAQINRIEGVESIRMRWYGKGSDTNKEIYVERKSYYHEPLGSKSIKNRFKLNESQVNDFVDSKYTSSHLRQVLEKSGEKNSSEVEDTCLIAEGIQESILNRKLKPVCRVFCNRTAFQSPDDQKLRISVDSDVTFIREDHMDGVMRRRRNKQGTNWRRSDIDIDYPFRNVSENDIVRFPYAVLETKIQTHLGQETPEWLTLLLNSHLVHKVPNFSKYVHGVSCLLEDLISESPEWLPELVDDIRKPPNPNIGLSRTKISKDLFNGCLMRSLIPVQEVPNVEKSESTEKPQKEETLALLNFDFDNTRIETAIGEPVLGIDRFEKTNDTQISISVDNTSPTKEEMVIDKEPSKDNKGLALQLFTKFGSRFIRKGEKCPKEPADASTLELGLNQSSSKVSKKPDAKAFFSNERTFMSWLQFCAILFTISLNLLNNGDGITRIVGALFIVVSSFVSIYALVRFHFRAFQIRTGRKSIRVDDIYGPGVLCAMLVFALAVNFYLRAPLLFGSKSLPEFVGHS